MDEQEAKALADIEKFGCHVLHILAEDDLPPFSYSIGIERTCGAPELIIVGLKQELAHSLINQYNDMAKEGAAPAEGSLHDGFLEGFAVTFKRVDRRHYREYMGWAGWLYKGDSFSTLQLIYPTTQGLWPWDEGAPDSAVSWQPILAGTEH